MSPSPDPTDASLEDFVAWVSDDCRSRLARGERPDPEEYAARRPGAADLIRRVVAAMRLAGTPTGRPDAVPTTLGDFRIVREAGRGGMGVVYEAEQLSLGRRVALKVLPFWAVMDPRRLRRFENEARAAAGLDHPNVVKVYGVGQDRDAHFIAMQFIDGRTLADVIRDRRGESAAVPSDPAYVRQVAEWGAKAADALEHAHGLGVVHRDVKPGNLLVDAKGELYVADFGLARVGHDAGVTESRDQLGTPRYMSPEQAAARHGLVDPRSDVYSLGATLYELLTLTPAFGGEDRAEVLRRIADEEPPAVRKREPRIPRDLETVVMKCLEKSPARRYQSAKELADDLRRFLADAPVLAKRRTVRERVTRWVGRRPRTVAAAVMILALALGGLAYWQRERSLAAAAARKAADEADAAARRVADEAEFLYRRRRLPEAEAVARRAADLLPRTGGDPDLARRVREMVADYTLLRRLDDARLERLVELDEDSTKGGDRSFTAAVAAFRDEYGIDILGADEAVLTAEFGRRAIRAELIAVLDDLATQTRGEQSRRLIRIADLLDPNAESFEKLLRRAVALGPPEVLRLLEEAETRSPPPAALVWIALSQEDLPGRVAAVRLLRIAHQAQPDSVWVNHALAGTLAQMGPDHASEALRHWTAVLALRPGSSTVLVNTGWMLIQLGRPGEALAYLRRAETLRPESVPLRNNLGIALAKLGRVEEAIAEFRRAIALSPSDSRSWHNLGVTLRDLGRHADAIDAMREAVRLQPDAGSYVLLSRSLYDLGEWAAAAAAAREALKVNPNDSEAYFRLGCYLSDHRPAEAVEAFRWSVLLRPEAVTCYNLGLALGGQGMHADAAAVFAQAVRRKPDYAQAHRALGAALVEKGDPGKAVAPLREAIRLKPDDPLNHYNLGVALSDLGDLGGAVVAYREVIRLDPGYPEAHCNLGFALRQQGRYRESLAEFRSGHELGSKRKDWKYPSEQWVREAEKLVERPEQRLGGSGHLEQAPPPRPVR